MQLLLRHIFVFLLLPVVARGLSSTNRPVNRRAGLSRLAKALGAVLVVPLIVSKDAQAACFPGDLSPECIGVYKIPLQDALSSPTLNSPEALKRNAPDVNYVQPAEQLRSILQAKNELLTQRAAADDIRDVVLAGRLEEAGIRVLNLIPKVTGAGMLLQQQVQSNLSTSDSGVNQMQLFKFQQTYQDFIAMWSQVDVEIGQALRGQLGVSAVAQLEILKSLKEATATFDEFLSFVDASIK